MSWVYHHTQSERYATEAQESLRQKDLERSTELYYRAAESERLALEFLDPNKTRTLGITAVSVVSLYYKAKRYSDTKKIAHKTLTDAALLPVFAIDQLEDLLQTIQDEEFRTQSDVQSSLDYSQGNGGMIIEIEGEGAVVATEELLALEGIQGSYQIPAGIEKDGVLATVATIVGITVGSMTVAEKIHKWSQDWFKSGSGSRKVLIIDDKGNRLLLKDATVDQIQSILKALEQK